MCRMFGILAGFVCFVFATALHAEPINVPIMQLSASSEDYVYQINGADLSEFSRYNRDYFTLLAITSTDESHGCQSCIHWKTIFRTVARAWYYDYLDTNYLLIVEADLIDSSNMELLEKMQISTVPQIWLIPPTNIANEYRPANYVEKDEFTWQPFDLVNEPHQMYEIPHLPLEEQALAFANWLASSLQKPIYLRQENAPSKFMMTFAVTFLTIMLFKKKGPSVVTSFVTKSKVYQVFYFGFLYLILGGIMFSFITPVPFLAQDENREVIYISGGTGYQFGIEMVIVGATYLVLGILLIALCYVGQYKVTGNSVITSDSMKGMAVLFVCGLLYLASSVLTSICLRKDHDYPYFFTKLF